MLRCKQQVYAAKEVGIALVATLLRKKHGRIEPVERVSIQPKVRPYSIYLSSKIIGNHLRIEMFDVRSVASRAAPCLPAAQMKNCYMVKRTVC